MEFEVQKQVQKVRKKQKQSCKKKETVR